MPAPMDNCVGLKAQRIIMSGRVQGVGFRPYIYRHAIEHNLHGWVRNTSGRVEIHVQGDAAQLAAFKGSLLSAAPPLSRPVIDSVSDSDCDDLNAFSILQSSEDIEPDIHLPADLFTCDDCLQELNDPNDRRYRYPFINCTQCGPRYTLIEALPYDRPNTSMADFDLCEACNREYTDPADRRYHAEPLACAACGPTLVYAERGHAQITRNEAALQAACDAIRAGRVIAVKGVGGYHLVCDAGSDTAVQHLRSTKPRPEKPLAVMFPSPPHDRLVFVRQYLEPDAAETRELESASRPIVLVRKRDDAGLSRLIAPGLDEVGAMLPYSPLHHLLLNDLQRPLVATSANISGEPVLTDNADVEMRLSHVAQGFLHHNRSIVRPADDPVLRIINGRPSPLRLGRGVAPVEITLPFEIDRPVLAVGAHMKNTITLAWGTRAVISPHIGEMDNRRSLQTFEACIRDLQGLYQVHAERIVCDAHPGYASTRWAHTQDVPVHAVYHHHAHAAVAFFDAILREEQPAQVLAFTWDGVGLGQDGTLWGGEALLGRPGRWRRAAHFRPFRLPGGERAGREPWRSAAALCWEDARDCPLEEASDPLLYRFWTQGRNAPLTSAAGRLFDAAAALCGVCSKASFEGQGPMQLEALAARDTGDETVTVIAPELSRENGVYIADWSHLLPVLEDSAIAASARAACFHRAMAETLLQQALRIREDTGVNTVGLCGGVFQNRVLTESVTNLLQSEGFVTSLPLMIPVNDAGISFGQIVEYALIESER